MRIAKTFLQRLLILALGLLSVWLIVFVLFDFADQRLPWLLALSLTYAIAAIGLNSHELMHWTTLIRGFHRQL